MSQAVPAFSTTSIYCAAFLLCEGFLLVGAKPDERGRFTFSLGGPVADLQTSLMAFRSGDAKANVQRFAAELRRLKAVIHGKD